MKSMTEKKYKFLKDSVATNLKTPILCNGEKMTIGEVLDELNKLNDENEELCNFNLHTINQELQEENKLLKEKLNEILELTGLTGMIHLRKAEIKSIIKR